MNKYILKPTRAGWYITFTITWGEWDLRWGCFKPIEILWNFWKKLPREIPRYVLVGILGFEIEVGKFRKRPETRRIWT